MTPKGRTTDGGVAREGGRLAALPRWVQALVPLVLLVLVLAAFVAANPLATFQGGEPLPDVTVSHHTLPNDETVVLHVTNNGPESVTVSQVLVDDAYWSFAMRGSGGDATLAPRESARVVIPYHWNPGWDLEVALVLSDGTKIHHDIEAPSETPGVSADLLWLLALIGLFVGVIPVALGMAWFPYIESMSDRWLHAVLAFSVGVLAFLAFDAGFEAFEVAGSVPGAFEGELLVVLGVIGALSAVQAVSAWGERKTGASPGLVTAYLVAVGIGLHNLAEGLAIGSSLALGRVSLGAFLVIGFMLHNVTEGPAVVAPVSRGRRPALHHFALLGLIAGAPVILGGWIGSLAYAPTLGAFFLAVGAGAILQVCWEVAGMIRRDAGRVDSPLNLAAFLVGLLVMYATDLFVTV
jgi:zinc transporter ZupT